MKKHGLDSKWLQWFLGFNDAQGNFQIYPKKNVLKSGIITNYRLGFAYHLSLHSRDMALIENIRKILNNVGVVYNYPNKNDSRLAVNGKAGLLYLIDNVFEIYPLLTVNQRNRYNLLKTTLMNGITHFKTLEEYIEYKSSFLLSNSVELNLIELYESGKLQVDN